MSEKELSLQAQRFLHKSNGMSREAIQRSTILRVDLPGLRWITEESESIAAQRHFPNEAVCCPRECLYLVAFEPRSKVPPKPARLLRYYWTQSLKPVSTITFFWDKLSTYRAYIFTDSVADKLLSLAPVRFVIVNDSTILAAPEIDLRAYAQQVSNREHQKESFEKNELFIDDEVGAKLYAHSYATSAPDASELLSRSYISRFDKEVRNAIDCIAKNTDPGNIQRELEGAKQSALAEHYSQPNFYRAMYMHFSKKLWVEMEDPIGLYMHAIGELEGRNCACLSYQAQQLFACALYNPSATAHGTRVPSHDLENKLELITLSSKGLGEKIAKFWSRIPWTILSFYREVIGPGNCPVDPLSFVSEVPLWQGEITRG